MEAIINKVAASGLITIDMEDFIDPQNTVSYDLAQNLFQGLILKEKDFRDFLKNHNWENYRNKNVYIICSADAIIPNWAYMLLITKLQPYVNQVVVGSLEDLNLLLIKEALTKLNLDNYTNARVVIKGCSKTEIPSAAYAEITKILLPFAASIMFGEPCSTVPVYKKKS